MRFSEKTNPYSQRMEKIMPKLMLSADLSTESLVQYITSELSDDDLDEIDIIRMQDESSKLATEPLTVAATITLSTTLVVAVCRIIERWIEMQNQLKHMKIIAEGFMVSDQAGKELAKVAQKHASVSIQYKLPGLSSNKGRT